MTACSSEIQDWGKPWADSFKTFKTLSYTKIPLSVVASPSPSSGQAVARQSMLAVCQRSTRPQYTLFLCDLSSRRFNQLCCLLSNRYQSNECFSRFQTPWHRSDLRPDDRQL